MLDVTRPVISHVLRGVLDAAQPNRLFAAGEQGVWYEPSDLTTLFQDSAGTTPVTAADQPVGLMLDKSRGLVLGSELWANQTPTIIDFSGTVGAYNTGTRTMSNSGVAFSGYPRFQFNLGMTAGRTYSVSGTLSGNITQIAQVRLAVSGSANNLAYNNSTGVFQGRVTATGQILEITTTLDGSETVTISNISVRELPGNHATQTTAGKRPVLEVDANGCYYLKGDATAGRAMVTPTITPGADKVQVFAGIRKLSDAAQAVIAEYSATIASNNGSLLLSAPNSAAANYNFSSKGTTQVDNTVTTYAAARTDVLSGLADIAGDSNSIRVSGKQAALVSTDQGTGNYGNYPLYLFGRAGTSLYFDGRIYGLIVRFGPNLNAVTIMDIERYMAGKTGIMF